MPDQLMTSPPRSLRVIKMRLVAYPTLSPKFPVSLTKKRGSWWSRDGSRNVPKKLLDDAEGLVALGVTLLTVGVNGPDYELSDVEQLCRWRDRA